MLFKILKKLVKARSTHKVTPTSIRDKDVVQAKIPKVYLTSGLSFVVQAYNRLTSSKKAPTNSICVRSSYAPKGAFFLFMFIATR